MPAKKKTTKKKANSEMKTLKDFAKRLKVKVKKGISEEDLREKVLDAIYEAGLAVKEEGEEEASEWATENADLLEYYNKYATSEEEEEEEDEPEESEEEEDEDEEEDDEPVKKAKKAKKKKAKTKAKKKAEKKKKVEKATKKENGGKVLSRFGHRPNTMSGFIDDLVAEGVQLKDAVKKLAKEFGREPDKAEKKFLSHVKHLERDVEVEIKEKDGFYKSKKKTL